MAVHENAEIRKGGNAIRVNVVVDGFVPVTGPAAGKVEWSGVLLPPNNTGLALGESYTLVLPGYSSAKIEITSEAHANDGTVTFKGVGEMPVGRPSEQIQGAK